MEAFDSCVGLAMQKTRVAYPGIIRSFDPETVSCEVDVGVMGAIPIIPENSTSIDRLNYDAQQFPMLLDAPVVFPRGGGCTLTFPVKPGDECLVIISSRDLDFWWQNGGVQNSNSGRNHDFSDAFVIPGPQSQAKKISNISPTAAQLRTDDGAAFVEVAAGHDITIQTPGKLTASANGGTEITSPEIVFNGNVTINGNLSQGMGSGGGTATMNGPVTVNNDVTAGGKSLTGHTHGGVQSGSGHTGAPD
ncbi:phage-related protein [Pantoea stewartii subsp. stewartii DC283]|uniref:Phage-related protein n=3 Tax=Pantoea stewartii TaxID=66269 RepID=H3RFS6_PANSE|nr:phage-related protein [Pantoea stewartii subsp. stewartii DC283]